MCLQYLHQDGGRIPFLAWPTTILAAYMGLGHSKCINVAQDLNGTKVICKCFYIYFLRFDPNTPSH